MSSQKTLFECWLLHQLKQLLHAAEGALPVFSRKNSDSLDSLDKGAHKVNEHTDFKLDFRQKLAFRHLVSHQG